MTALLLSLVLAAEPVNELNQYLYPSMTGLVAVIDLQVAKRSGYFDDQLQQGFDQLLKGNEQLQQLSQLLDFDPLKQVESITICGSDKPGDRSFFLIVNGQFPHERFNEALSKMVDDGQLSVFDIQELMVYFNHRERQAMYFSVVDGRTVIATPSKTWMEDAIQGLTELRTLQADFVERLSWKAKEPSQAVRLAGLFPDQARRQIASNPMFAGIAEDLVGYNVSVQLTENPRIRLRLTLTDAEAADQADVLFATLIQLGKTALANSPRQDLLQVLNSVDTEPKDEHLLIEVTMTGELFKEIIANNREQRQRMRERRQQRQEQAQ